MMSFLIFTDVIENRYTHEKGSYAPKKVRKIVTHKVEVLLRDNDPLFTTI